MISLEIIRFCSYLDCFKIILIIIIFKIITLLVIAIMLHLIYQIYFICRSTSVVVTYKEDTNMISSDVIRGYNDTIILFLLLEGDSYGYEISKNIRSLTNEQYIMKETTLYSAFNRLSKNGYISSYYGDETQGKRRTYFRITDAGQEYYKEKCKEWVLTQNVINRFIKEMDDYGDY